MIKLCEKGLTLGEFCVIIGVQNKFIGGFIMAKDYEYWCGKEGKVTRHRLLLLTVSGKGTVDKLAEAERMAAENFSMSAVDEVLEEAEFFAKTVVKMIEGMRQYKPRNELDEESLSTAKIILEIPALLSSEGDDRTKELTYLSKLLVKDVEKCGTDVSGEVRDEFLEIFTRIAKLTADIDAKSISTCAGKKAVTPTRASGRKKSGTSKKKSVAKKSNTADKLGDK